jgi:threonine synthase
MFLTHLECTACGLQHEWWCLQNVCLSCGKPLSAIIDLNKARRTLTREAIATREKSLWRYREVLPLPGNVEPVSLGEGGTPLLRAQKFGDGIDLWIKDESLNPTQSFKARGMSVAVSMAKHLGATKLAAPSAGNAGGALAAYAARAGLEAHIFMPRDTPRANIVECRQLGAHVTLIDGLITDCGAEIAQRKAKEGWFDMSTLKEPYRVEGKKTLGYELAEQCNWRLPDVILYPTGGGTGLIGMWKAFSEMEELGWMGEKRPRMFAVQAAGCAPIVRAFEAGEKTAAEFPDAYTIASGLRVPKAVGDFLILNILRQSNGGAIAIDDEEMIRVARELGSSEGLFVAPEAAACFAALKSLRSAGRIGSRERVVIFNTGSGIKYLDCYQNSNQPPSYSLTYEDGDALGKGLRGLSIETSSQFECVCAQSFASLTDQLLEFREFIAQRCVAVFPLQARPKKLEIVLAPQYFA